MINKNTANDEYLCVIEEVLNEVGVYAEEMNPEMKMDELILDSMSLVSFYVELEARLDICLPDEIYSVKLSEYTVERFWNEMIGVLL